MEKKRIVRTPSKRKTSSSLGMKLVKGTFFSFLLVVLSVAMYQNRNRFLYYLGFKSNNPVLLNAKDRAVHDVHINSILKHYSNKTIGIDVSEYQGYIDWNVPKKLQESYEIDFVISRATAGKNKVDTQFKHNWNTTKGKYIRGAYHYYRPNENSIAQAENFIKTVRLTKGDLPPILDIEKLPKTQSIDSLKVGLRRWLVKVEEHYKVKPIIYSGESYYSDFLKEEFSEYPFWIANYNFWKKEVHRDWWFWQFTEKAQVSGIKGLVDVNIYDGLKVELLEKCVK